MRMDSSLPQLRGLYLITNHDPLPLLLQKLDIALATTSVALLQYRRKHTASENQPAEIEQIRGLCTRYQVPLVINDNVHLAAQFGLGVHLGQNDGSLLQARTLLGEQAIIGRTCGQSLAWAREAAVQGASYLAFGAVYPSSSKPEAKSLDLRILTQARREFHLPICSIGGLTLDNVMPVLACGTDLCAVIGDVLNRPVDEIAPRVQAWAAQFSLQSV